MSRWCSSGKGCRRCAMEFHWYWPFARPEELEWATATLRPGERMLVQVVDREAAPAAGSADGVIVVRDLPDVDRSSSGLRWPVSRATTYLRRARARKRVWRDGHFDLVHLHYVNRFTDAFARFPRPLVMSVHDVVPHVPRLGHGFERRLLTRLYRRPDALVVHHIRLANALVDEFDVDRSRVHVVPHQVFPVDNPPERPPAGAPLVLFFGAFRPNKGIEVLAEMMEHLDGIDLRLAIVGRGDEPLERMAVELSLVDPRVTAEVGFATLQRKRELFGLASVVVLPYTQFASQSGVLHDAYGHGRPVVVTDVGALGDAVREDGTGFVVPPGDALALADGVRAALQPNAWDGYAAAARQVAIDRSPANIGVRLREVYDTLLN